MSSSILVKDLMSRNIKTARPDTKLREIIQKMVKFNISSVIVVERDRPAGIITERDILLNLGNSVLNIDVTEAKDVMSGPLIFIGEDADIMQASSVMLKNNIKKIPVIRDQKIIGIVTSSDIVRGTHMLTGTLRDICSIGKN